MDGDGFLILRGDEVAALLAGREGEVVEAVRRAYLAFAAGEGSLPHSTFLRFPGNDRDRIIGLPAYLGGGFEVAGMKWIASFPGNVARGMARASAVLVLNSCDTGHPQALLESSLISAQRTAASAALAARALCTGDAPVRAGLVGTGVINREIARYLLHTLPGIGEIALFDLDRERAARFAAGLEELLPEVRTEVAASLEELLASCPLVSFATTAGKPHVQDLSPCPPGATLLHVSLRDLAPGVILASDNVVDDPDHVARERTSIHLAQQQTGDLAFIRATLAQVLDGSAPAKVDPEAVTVFSPFGLGVLDLAVGKLAYDQARAQGLGTEIAPFLPTAAGP